jgi:hypothetical protein
MNIWEPYSPAVYLLHTILGTAGVLAAVVALASRKGSRPHVFAGRVFVAAALVAAGTAIAFSFTAFSLLAVVSSLLVVTLIAGAILALRPRTPRVALGETVALVVMGFCALMLVVITVMLLLFGAPALIWLRPALYAPFPLYFLWRDVQYRRLSAPERNQAKFGRHLSRMAFAFAIAVHAPIVSFGDDLGLDPLLAFFGPFIIWPLVLLAFRRHRLLRTSGADAA